MGQKWVTCETHFEPIFDPFPTQQINNLFSSKTIFVLASRSPRFLVLASIPESQVASCNASGRLSVTPPSPDDANLRRSSVARRHPPLRLRRPAMPASTSKVEKLKDLCLSQREEIKSLKSAVLFPEVTNNELQEQLEKQGTELRQAKMIIPALQKQVTSLAGQLQCLADDLAEVKADTYSARACFQHQIGSSPRTPIYKHEEAANSLFSSSEATAPGSPDDLFLKDLNPCLTPNNGKIGSMEFKEELEYSSSRCVDFSDGNIGTFYEAGFNPCPRKLSKSSDCCQNLEEG